MRVLALVGWVLAGLALVAGWLVLVTFIIVWNVTDIQAVGVNFWNVFWLLLAAIGTLGSGFGLTRR